MIKIMSYNGFNSAIGEEERYMINRQAGAQHSQGRTVTGQ